MGLWRERRQQRRFVALAAGLVVIGLPALARGDPVRTVGPGPVTGFDVRGNTVEIAALPTARAQVVFHTDDLFRIWMAPDGAFTDPANTPPERDGAPAANVVVKRDWPGVTPHATDAGAYHLLTTRSLALRVYKANLRFALYRPDNRTLIWEELVGPTWDGRQTTQVLARGAAGAVLRRRHAERPVLPPGPDHQGGGQLQLGRRRPPQLGAVLRQHRRLRRAAQHPGPRLVLVHAPRC